MWLVSRCKACSLAARSPACLPTVLSGPLRRSPASGYRGALVHSPFHKAWRQKIWFQMAFSQRAWRQTSCRLTDGFRRLSLRQNAQAACLGYLLGRPSSMPGAFRQNCAQAAGRHQQVLRLLLARMPAWDGNPWAQAPGVLQTTWRQRDEPGAGFPSEPRSANDRHLRHCAGEDPWTSGCGANRQPPCAAEPALWDRVRAGCPAPDRAPAAHSRPGESFRQNGRSPQTSCAVRGYVPQSKPLRTRDCLPGAPGGCGPAQCGPSTFPGRRARWQRRRGEYRVRLRRAVLPLSPGMSSQPRPRRA